MKNGELDVTIVMRARRGDARAFRALYEHHADALYGFLYRMLRERGAAEDALQDTFVRVLSALPRFEPDGPARLSSWIFGIGRRVALTALERARPRPPPPPDLQASTGGEPVQHLRFALEAAMTALPVALRSIFVLRECCDLSYAELATLEGIDIGTVKSRLHRARSALAAILGEDAIPSEDGSNHEARATK
jgi:RNA polymerase sigma factor (sigma-70 family)